MRCKKHEAVAPSESPPTVPERDGSKVDAAALYRAAGIEAPERPHVSRLTETWRGHFKGAWVLHDEDGNIYVFDR